MRLVDATGAEPYIVLNLAGKSGTEPPESRLYNSSQLKACMPMLYVHTRRSCKVCKQVSDHCASVVKSPLSPRALRPHFRSVR